MTPVGRRWPSVLLWMAIAAALVAVRIAPLGFSPRIAHDSFQYFSVAEQALRGSPGETALVHFDAERTFGRVPAPLVTFPLGYPAALGLFAATGLSLPAAALAVNMVAVLACVALLWWITGVLGFRPLFRHVVVGAWAVNGASIHLSGTASTEALFTALVLAGTALLLRARIAPAPSWWRWGAAGLLFGLSYHVRYAGLFLVVGLGAVAGWQLLRRRRALFIGYTLACVAAAALVGAGFARNIALVGNWRGGNEKVVRNPAAGVLFETARAANNLVLGPQLPGRDPTRPLRAVFVVGVVTGVALLARARPRGEAVAAPPAASTAGVGIDLLILTGVYCALMFYAGLTTVISYGVRMFVPVVPQLAILAGIALARVAPADAARARGGAARLLLGGAAVLFVGLNLFSLRAPHLDRAMPVTAQLDATTDAGRTVRQLVASTAPGIIIANNGQAVGFLLQRPTVSLVGPHYSSTVWDDATLRQAMTAYQVKALVITAPNPEQPESTDLIPSDFVRALARGEAPPWLRLVGTAGAMRVYVPVVEPRG